MNRLFIGLFQIIFFQFQPTDNVSTEHVVQLAKNAKCGFCTACFTGEYAVRPEEVLSPDIHERHLNDRPKNEKKLGE